MSTAKSSRLFGKLNLAKLAALGIILCGLATVLHLPRLRAQADPGAPLSGVVSLKLNPLQIAILHWYNANFTASFPVGNGPFSMAFDGANIWVTNAKSNNVTELRAADGAPMGTFALPAGTARCVAFDGANIWVAGSNSGVGTVTKLRAADGTTLGTFSVGANPDGVAFDGANIWVTNELGFTVTKLRASDGTTLGTFNVGNDPVDVAFDGANVWVANEGSGTVTKLQASNGAKLGTFATGSSPIAVAFDGANIWVANAASNTVSKL